jgi:hypothetical protein
MMEELIKAIERDCTGWQWLLRTDRGRYFAHIYQYWNFETPAPSRFIIGRADTPIEALQMAYDSWMETFHSTH